MQASLTDCERRLALALEILGERNERIDLLEDDVLEMKTIFRAQLSLAADQLAAAQAEAERLANQQQRADSGALG